MERQLLLLTPTEPEASTTAEQPAQHPAAHHRGGAVWQLAPTTRAIGKRGVAQARAALRAARRGEPSDPRHQAA